MNTSYSSFVDYVYFAVFLVPTNLQIITADKIIITRQIRIYYYYSFNNQFECPQAESILQNTNH